MGYKYPKGAKNVDSVIADVVSTVAWIDLVLQLKLTHIKYPLKMSSRVSEVSAVFEKFQDYSMNHVAKLSYREKIDEFFKIVRFSDKQYRKGIKTLMMKLGEIRNKVAHNAAISLADDKLNLADDTVAAHIINEQYELFNEIFKRVEPFIAQLEKSME